MLWLASLSHLLDVVLPPVEFIAAQLRMTAFCTLCNLRQTGQQQPQGSATATLVLERALLS